MASFSRTYAVVMLAPLTLFVAYMIRFTLGGISLNVLDVLLGAAIGVGVVRLWPDRGLLLRRYRLFLGFVAMFLFAAALPIVAVGGPAATTIAGQWKSLVLLPGLYGTVLAGTIDRGIVTRSTAAAFALTGVFGVAVAALVAYGGVQQVTYDGRLAFPYQSPNQLAMVLAPMLAGFAVVTILQRKPITRWRWMIFGALTLSLLLTQSAGAMSAAVFVIAATVLCVISRSQRRWAIVGIVVAVLLVGVVSAQSGWLSSQMHDRTSLRSRIEIWRSAVLLIQQHGVPGIGFGVFQERYLALQPLFSPYQEWAVPHPHNVFFAAMLGSGIFGLASLLGVLGLVATRGRYTTPLVVGVGLGIFVMALHGFVDTTIFRNDLAVLFWGAVAFLVSSRYS